MIEVAYELRIVLIVLAITLTASVLVRTMPPMGELSVDKSETDNPLPARSAG